MTIHKSEPVKLKCPNKHTWNSPSVIGTEEGRETKYYLALRACPTCLESFCEMLTTSPKYDTLDVQSYSINKEGTHYEERFSLAPQG